MQRCMQLFTEFMGRCMCFLPSEVAAGHSVVVEVSPDIHICGFCKQQYNNFEVFLAHKQNGCSQPPSGTSASTVTTTLAGKKKKKKGPVVNSLYAEFIRSLACPIHSKPVLFLSSSGSSTGFVFEETYQSCVMQGVKKILTKAQKTPSKKLKPALISKRHSCCFSGWCLLPFMTVTHSSFAAIRQENCTSWQPSPESLVLFVQGTFTLMFHEHTGLTQLVKGQFLLIHRLHF